MISKCRLSYIEQGDPVAINELGKKRSDGTYADYTAHIDTCIQGLLKVRAWPSASICSSACVPYINGTLLAEVLLATWK